MEGSKVTSKTSSLKALLLRAWRERWSDLQWGIHIKTILPRGVSGDVYNLADCILQQALFGPGPNQLVLSYLKHSLSSQLVSYAAVLQRIAKFDGFHKPHCVNCLLELIESLLGGITCRGKPEEGILAAAVLSLAHWLVQCFLHAASQGPNLPTTSRDMLNKPAAILRHMLNCDFLTAMLFLAIHEDKALAEEVKSKCMEVEELLAANPVTTPVPIQDSLAKLCRLELGPRALVKGNLVEEDLSEPLTYCVQALLSVLVSLHPTADNNTLCSELRLVQRLKGYSASRLCSEVIRASLMSLHDVVGTSEAPRWGAFTFHKLPRVLHQLVAPPPDSEASEDIVQAVDQLLLYPPLIDLVDSAASSHCIEALLVELTKVRLLTDKHVKDYTVRRDTLLSGVSKANPGSPDQPAIPNLIMRAHGTLQRILQTLDADYSKIQEAIPSVLCQVLTGKSFDLILSVATVEGKLQTFVSKLIKFNEYSKGSNSSRPILFDTTFLMLCSMVQTYGSEVVFSEGGGMEGEDKSFLEQWVQSCMLERGKPKSPDSMLLLSDAAHVERLLTLLKTEQPDFSSLGLSWSEICWSVPGAIKEVLIAWEQGALSATDVKHILDNMRNSMCCLPICASAWLSSAMQILHQDALLKPMNMIQQFLTGGTPEDGQDYLKERSTLMMQIIRKMQYDMYLATSSKTKYGLSGSISSKEPMMEELAGVWAGVDKRGWLSNMAVRSLETLYLTAGPSWFVSSLLSVILKNESRFSEELNKSVDLAFAVLHIDIETCTGVLLTEVLPQYLHNNSLSGELMEPRTSAFARLLAYSIYAAWEAQGSSTRKRPCPQDDEGEDLLASKMLRLEEGPLVLKSASSGLEETDKFDPGPIREPLLSQLKKMFASFSIIAEHTPYISQGTHLVLRVLELLASCGGRHGSPSILHLIPPNLVRSLVRSLPDMFTTDLILKLYDLSSPSSRKAAASDLCLLRNMNLKSNIVP